MTPLFLANSASYWSPHLGSSFQIYLAISLSAPLLSTQLALPSSFTCTIAETSTSPQLLPHSLRFVLNTVVLRSLRPPVFLIRGGTGGPQAAVCRLCAGTIRLSSRLVQVAAPVCVYDGEPRARTWSRNARCWVYDKRQL